MRAKTALVAISFLTHCCNVSIAQPETQATFPCVEQLPQHTEFPDPLGLLDEGDIVADDSRLRSAPNSQSDDLTFRLEYQPAPVDNPLKGLVPYAGQGTRKDGSIIFPHSMEFSYLPLGGLMRGMDNFTWEPIEQLLGSIAGRGHQAVLRIYLEYPGKENSIPRFLVDGGLEVHAYTNTNTQPFPPKPVETPDYGSPMLHAALTNFIAALGRRYDGDPRLGFITAGLLGTWGEWHTYPRSDLWASKATQRLVMDAYAAAFQQTPVLLRYPAGPGDSTYADNHGQPFGYHDDSFAHSTLHTGRQNEDWFFMSRLLAAGAADKWRRFPIGGEVRPEVWGCCFDQPPCTPKGQTFGDCVEATHVTWLMDSGVFTKPLSEQRRTRAITSVRRMGYELQVIQASCREADEKDSFKVSVTLTNRGVAPFYHDWPVELGFASDSGQLILQHTTDWKLQEIIPGTHATVWTTRVKPLPGDAHHLLLRVKNPLKNGRPFSFANKSQNRHVDGWLTLGSIKPKG